MRNTHVTKYTDNNRNSETEHTEVMICARVMMSCVHDQSTCEDEEWSPQIVRLGFNIKFDACRLYDENAD